MLVAPRWIQEVKWADKVVAVTMARDAIQNVLEWDSSMPPDRNPEVEIYKHCDRTGYW